MKRVLSKPQGLSSGEDDSLEENQDLNTKTGGNAYRDSHSHHEAN